MKHACLYDLKTGIFTGRTLLMPSDAAITFNTPEGQAAWLVTDTAPDVLRQRVQDGKLVDYTPPPPTPEQLAATAHDAALVKLRDIDTRSIRAIREALAASGSAKIVALESEADAARTYLIKEA